MNETDLKPCPFCGCERIILERQKWQVNWDAKEKVWVYDLNHSAICTRCKASSGWHGTRDEAVIVWNERAHE